jgi:hypothetical protein
MMMLKVHTMSKIFKVLTNKLNEMNMKDPSSCICCYRSIALDTSDSV